jgi:hypothetical protein
MFTTHNKWLWVGLTALPLAVAGGLFYANANGKQNDQAKQEVTSGGYVCPITGEELPCPKCCPLNQKSP